MTDKHYAFCPKCYDGIIVKDKKISNVFFCNKCFREIKIEKFAGVKK